MKYNLKITEYPDNIQVSYYDKSIVRSDDNEDDITNNKYIVGNNIQKSWYNPKNNKIEIIPYGFSVKLDPFTGEEYLYKELSDNEIEKERIKNVFRSLRRTKQNIYEIARGSVWDLFVTLTIADKDIRFDLDTCKKKIGKKINNIRQRASPDLKYILIFERHPTSQAWHIHGLFKGIDGLTLEKAFNPHTGELIYKNDMQVYNIKDFDTIGFSTATYVNDNNRVTQYILKYISKDLAFEYPNKKAYLCSKGLPRGEELLLEIENENEILEKLKDCLGYVPELTHMKLGYNYYNGGDVKYLQYKKDGGLYET